MKFLKIILLFLLNIIVIKLSSQVVINFFVNQPEELIVFAGEDTTICGGEAVQFNYVISGGTPPYAVDWTPHIEYPVTTTNYIITVTDANACTAVDTVTVFVIECSGISDENFENFFLIHPNPSENGVFTLQVKNQKFQVKSIEVYNIYGQIVTLPPLFTSPNGKWTEIKLDLSHHSKGIYILKVQTKEFCWVRKLIY